MLHRHNSRRLITVILCVYLIAAVNPLHAQTPAATKDPGQDQCRFKTGQTWSKPYRTSLTDCARTLGNEIARQSLKEIFGSWGTYDLRADVQGRVYWSVQKDGQQPKWRYWGSWRLTISEIISMAAADINDFWEATLGDDGYHYQTIAKLVPYHEEIDTPCGTSELDNAMYCENDDRIYYDTGLFADFHRRVGDYAPVVILAHEWGHAIQRRLGIFDQDHYSIQIELQADCFAGAYSGYAEQSSTRFVLEKGDIEEGARSLFDLGDPDDTPWFEEDAHGTPIQRMAAFTTGVQNGYKECLSIVKDKK
jgi:predicted metalloprotease